VSPLLAAEPFERLFFVAVGILKKPLLAQQRLSVSAPLLYDFYKDDQERE
jgi:hypothetical protein